MKTFSEIFSWITESNRKAIDKLEFICNKMKELDDRAKELQGDSIRCIYCGDSLSVESKVSFWSFWSKEHDTRMYLCEKCFRKD